MSWPPVVVCAALLVANPVIVGRVHRWWIRRHHERRDFCETCGAQPRRIRVLRSGFDDDHALGIGEGGSFVTATYCRSHAPEGSRPRANPKR